MAEVAELTHGAGRTEPPQETALRRMIEAERLALDHSLDRLGDRFRETIDWRRQASRHRGALMAAASGAALVALGAGIGVGMLVGASIGSGGRSRGYRRMFPSMALAVADAVLDVFEHRR